MRAVMCMKPFLSRLQSPINSIRIELALWRVGRVTWIKIATIELQYQQIWMWFSDERLRDGRDVETKKVIQTTFHINWVTIWLNGGARIQCRKSCGSRDRFLALIPGRAKILFFCNVYGPILGHTVSYIKFLARSFSLPRNKTIKIYGLGS
jgi:hypothetical protein